MSSSAMKFGDINENWYDNKMEIKEIQNKQEWEGFILTCNDKTFLQSFAWGDFHLSLGNKIWRFGIYEDNKLISVALTVSITSRRGKFLLIPHGPVTKEKGEQYQVIKLLLEKLKELAGQEKADFIRICPIWKRTDENAKYFTDLGFRTAPLHYHPESSWKLNIEKSEQELLGDMRKSTRYLIKQAQQNKDIEVIKSATVTDLDVFYEIHDVVAKAQKFVPFSLQYLKKEFLAFLEDPSNPSGQANQITLSFAKYQGKYIAASFEIFYSGMGFYHHAGLLPEYRKLPVSHLLQWEAIKEAKRRGCKIYDFWGYSDPLKNPKHPYSGPTLFKMGFGGYKDEYVKTQDYVISPKYWISYIIEKVRKYKRRL